jgi:hypothetical protein
VFLRGWPGKAHRRARAGDETNPRAVGLTRWRKQKDGSATNHTNAHESGKRDGLRSHSCPFVRFVAHPLFVFDHHRPSPRPVSARAMVAGELGTELGP